MFSHISVFKLQQVYALSCLFIVSPPLAAPAVRGCSKYYRSHFSLIHLLLSAVAFPLAGAEPVFVETSTADGFLMTAEQLRAALTPRSRLLIMCTPSNPSGAVYPRYALRHGGGPPSVSQPSQSHNAAMHWG